MRRNEYRFAAHPDGSITFEGANEVPRNPNADRNTTPDQKRRMAYRVARRMLQDGQLRPGTSDVEIEMIAVDIAIECDCSEAVAQRAVRTMVGANLRDDAPEMPPGVDHAHVNAERPLAVALGRAAENLNWRLRSLVWSNESGLPAAQPKVPAKPPVPPQSFERPKRRIVLE